MEHLLAHRSGIGDYLDEEDPEFDVTEYVLPVPVHELVTTDKYLPVLDGRPAKLLPDERSASERTSSVATDAHVTWPLSSGQVTVNEDRPAAHAAPGSTVDTPTVPAWSSVTRAP